MNNVYLSTLSRWIILPFALVGLAMLLYFITRRLGWHKLESTGFALVSPWVIGFVCFTAIPIVWSFYLSFTNYSLFGTHEFIGFGNYIKLFTNDIEFPKSIKITILYAFLSLPIGVLGSLLVAIVLNREIKGIKTFRTIFYLTSILPEAAVALIWRQLFNGESGLINYILSPFGVGKIDWFGDPKYVLAGFVIISVWGIFGTNTIIFLAALKGVPKSLYEAASIDGARALRKFWSITVPQISSVILLQIVMGLINALQIFTVAQFLRPTSQAGKFMNQLVYERGFAQLNMGEASAIAWILCIIILLLTLLVFKSSPAWVHYETEAKKVR
jgi:multiple sugar transport system permease protein